MVPLIEKTWMGFLEWVVRTLARLPLNARITIGRACGRFFALFPTRDTRIAEAQLEIFMKEKGGKKLLPAVYGNIGQLFTETVNFDEILRGSKMKIECEGLEMLKGLLKRGKGVVALIGHTGNWELMAAYVVQQGLPLATIGREARSKFLHKLLVDFRNRDGVKTLWRADRAAIKTMVSHLKDNYIVAAMIDQDTKVRSLALPFFGYPAATPTTIIQLAHKHDCSIISAFQYRTSRTGYKIQFKEINSNLSVEEIVAVYNQHLEKIVKEHPEQWVWFHKRWRTKEDGRRPSSREYLKFLEKMAEEKRRAS